MAFLLKTILLLTFLLSFAHVHSITIEYINKIIAQGPYAANWASIESLYNPPKWYLDAKFGFYTHWLISSVPAFGSEWYPRNMYVPGSSENKHQIATYGPLTPTNGYKEFIPSFTGKNFDPNDWMTLFQKAGAKYAGPVGEHHDGFPMFNCSESPYNAVVMGPKRDVAALLRGAANALPEKMYFLLSSHRAWHFAFYNNGRKWPNSDVNQCACPSWQEQQKRSFVSNKDTQEAADPFYCNLYCPANPNETTPTDAFMQDWLLRTCEMADSYTPDVLYFDWWIGVSPVWQPYIEKMAAFYYNRLVQDDKVGVINTKGSTMPAGTDVLDFERGEACAIQKRYWQTDTSISVRSWGYINDDVYKSAPFLVNNLVDIVSKNGGLLLNVGPPPNGTIPEAARTSFEAIGAWLKVNGDAIYASRPYHVFSEGPTQLGCGSFSDDDTRNFTVSDFRFTVSPAKSLLNVVCMGASSGDRVLVKSLGSGRLGQGSVTSVRVLGYTGTVDWTVDASGLHLVLPKNIPIPTNLPPVLSVSGLTDLQWDGIVRQGHDSSVVLYASSADAFNNGVSLDVSGNYITVGGWTSRSSVTWTARITTGGNYQVTVFAASPAGTLPGKLHVQSTVVGLVIPMTASSTTFALSASQTLSLHPQDNLQFLFEVAVTEVDNSGDSMKAPTGLQVAYVQLVKVV